MGKIKGQRRYGPQAHRHAVQHFGLVTSMGTVSSQLAVRLPQSIGQIPPRDFSRLSYLPESERCVSAASSTFALSVFSVE